MEAQLVVELYSAIAQRDAAQARFMAALNPLPIDPAIKARGYVAIKAEIKKRQAKLRAATIERDAASAAYQDVRQRFLAADHAR